MSKFCNQYHEAYEKFNDAKKVIKGLQPWELNDDNSLDSQTVFSWETRCRLLRHFSPSDSASDIAEITEENGSRLCEHIVGTRGALMTHVKKHGVTVNPMDDDHSKGGRPSTEQQDAAKGFFKSIMKEHIRLGGQNVPTDKDATIYNYTKTKSGKSKAVVSSPETISDDPSSDNSPAPKKSAKKPTAKKSTPNKAPATPASSRRSSSTKKPAGTKLRYQGGKARDPILWSKGPNAGRINRKESVNLFTDTGHSSPCQSCCDAGTKARENCFSNKSDPVCEIDKYFGVTK